jgi:hypothetical protein
MAHGQPPPHAAHDRLLVIGVATAVLGVVLAGHGVLLAEPATHRVSREHAARMPAERMGPAQEERLTTDTPATNSVPPTPRAASSGASTNVASCSPQLELDQDLRLVLAAMARHRQRLTFARERPAGYLGEPANKVIFAKYRELAGAEGSVALAEASPPAAPLSTVPGC